jgi:ferric-dicitrate binding protein FerR (iron transport regulator)
LEVDKQFKELLEKYKNGSITRDELNRLVKIYSEHKHLEFVLNSDIQEEWQQGASLSEKGRGTTVTRRLPIRRIAAVAASLLLILSIGFYFFSRTGDELLQYATDYGEQKQIELPDGSTVQMNANTQIEWDNDWQEEGIRRVKISGEAFFDVAHLAANTQFVVETQQLKVHVTGTSFNVRDRHGDVDVFLNSGSINLELNEGERDPISMQPGEEANYEGTTKDLVINPERTLAKSASWVEGMFEFENEYLSEILKSFEDLYGVSFEIRNEKLLEKRLDFSLPYSADWEMLKEALEIALKVEFIENQQQIIVQ